MQVVKWAPTWDQMVFLHWKYLLVIEAIHDHMTSKVGKASKDNDINVNLNFQTDMRKYKHVMPIKHF